MTKERSIPVSRPRDIACQNCEFCNHAITVAINEEPSASAIQIYCNGQRLEVRAIKSEGPSTHAAFECKWDVSEKCPKPHDSSSFVV